MNFRIEVSVKNGEKPGMIDVTVRRVGRVNRKEGGIAGGLQFVVTEAVRGFMGKMEAQHGEESGK